jgi:cell wall-associated NlpC family hydrolase
VRIQTLVPRLLVISAGLFLGTAAIAQNSTVVSSPPASIPAKAAERLQTQPAVATETRPRVVTPATAVSPAPVAPVPGVTGRFDQSLLVAIQSHLGATYHFNRTGPDEFDCSGLVWRAFQDVGVNFERGPARSYWATFAAPPKSEEFKFGTLVFFNNLHHVGIVVDDKGFYHSARHGGVMYSPFNEYWLSRIDGFRRIPSVQSAALATTASKTGPATKPVGAIAAAEPK